MSESVFPRRSSFKEKGHVKKSAFDELLTVILKSGAGMGSSVLLFLFLGRGGAEQTGEGIGFI